MTILILFSLLGIAFLVFLFALVVLPSPSNPEGSAKSLISAHHALSVLQHSLLSERLTNQIFSDEDLKYVSSIGSPEVVELLLAERRRLALLWVAQVRSQIRNLMRFQRTQSGFYANLSVSAELSLVNGFWSLLLFCRALEFFIVLRGPYRARSAVRRTVSAAAHLCDLTGGPIAFLSSMAADLTVAPYRGGKAAK